ncbi:hypothetical protein HYV50_01845 [Candidatus Pacearchaeota archaeon]|nr:hypothetical protein [Candidatus Pacearchaeota archaeon]
MKEFLIIEDFDRNIVIYSGEGIISQWPEKLNSKPDSSSYRITELLFSHDRQNMYVTLSNYLALAHSNPALSYQLNHKGTITTTLEPLSELLNQSQQEKQESR